MENAMVECWLWPERELGRSQPLGCSSDCPHPDLCNAEGFIRANWSPELHAFGDCALIVGVEIRGGERTSNSLVRVDIRHGPHGAIAFGSSRVDEEEARALQAQAREARRASAN